MTPRQKFKLEQEWIRAEKSEYRWQLMRNRISAGKHLKKDGSNDFVDTRPLKEGETQKIDYEKV
jgi:hypothetical protein